ncbi:MAG: DNA topoisomerase, partial [Bacillota bacterium]
ADWRSHDGQSRLFDQAKAESIATKVQGQIGSVVEAKKDLKSEPAPLAYDLTELQRDANRRYGFSAQRTLSVLQDLYEVHKLVTYPRTDSRYISHDIVPTLPARLKAMGVGPYADLVRPLIGKPLSTTKRFVDDSRVSDHHAIIPTEQPLRIAELKADERNLYDLIARRFIAVLYPPFRYEQITLVTEIAGERFYARGKIVRDDGWRAVTARSAERDEGRDEDLPEQTLSTINRGERRVAKTCKTSRAKTKPPARYTEATLLTAMENPGKFIEDEELREAVKQGGLGTPATRAEIIEKIIGTFYVERQGKELAPTSKGMQLIDLVASELRSPELTAQWEQQLSEIAKGKGSRARFMAEIRQHAAKLVQSVVSDTATYHPDNVTKTKCPACGKYMLLVKGKRGKMLVCPDRVCGYRQPEREETGVFKSSRKDQRVNQRLIAEYSDQGSIGTNLGDLLKAALEKSTDQKKQ